MALMILPSMPRGGLGTGYRWPDPYYPEVVLLMHMDGANGTNTFTDIKNNTKYTVSVGGTSKGEAKYGLYSDGNYSGGTDVGSETISNTITNTIIYY